MRQTLQYRHSRRHRRTQPWAPGFRTLRSKDLRRERGDLDLWESWLGQTDLRTPRRRLLSPWRHRRPGQPQTWRWILETRRGQWGHCSIISLPLTRQHIGADPQCGPDPQGREVHGAQTSLETGGAGQVDIFLPGESSCNTLNTGGRHPGCDCSGKCESLLHHSQQLLSC